VALFAWLIRRGRQLPAGLGTLGWVLAALLVELYAAPPPGGTGGGAIQADARRMPRKR
jgi:hypothetical protein